MTLETNGVHIQEHA